MKAGSSKHFDQCYNAQAAVDLDGSMLILGTYVTDCANDKNELQTLQFETCRQCLNGKRRRIELPETCRGTHDQ